MSSPTTSPFNWQAFLLFAQQNAGAKSETLKRTSASRAYYALFNVCRDFLESLGHTIPNTRAHKLVWEVFKNAPDADPSSAPDWRLLAQHGTTLRTLRNQADYDDQINQFDRRLANAINIATQGFQLLPTLKTK
ncbi:MAG: hypothetical protein H0X39_05505 [Actinobacteria bacterium]|nr:hypothetical protein [Actinomycetota bacterium]